MATDGTMYVFVLFNNVFYESILRFEKIAVNVACLLKFKRLFTNGYAFQNTYKYLILLK